MDFFFSNDIDNQIIILDNDESRHCIKVMRHKVGDLIKIVDGLGNLYSGNLVSFDRNSCTIQINDKTENYKKRNQHIHIGISPIKNQDRLEWFIEKSVEIGIDEITLIDCDRTLRKKIKIDRLNKIAITAMKQSLKAYIPKINDVISVNDFIMYNQNSSKFICHLDNDDRRDVFYYKDDIKKYKNVSILIGPEGDFSASEIELAVDNDFLCVTLGNSRLRTETAGIVACHLFNLMNSY
jgi:16S rRNA (uracil1498-N3)-methyltransferase